MRLLFSLVAAESSTALSAAATFIACSFCPSTLRVSGAASLALGGPFRSGSRLGRDSRLGTALDAAMKFFALCP